MRRRRTALATLLVVCAATTASAQAPVSELTAVSVLPPGDSGFFSLTGQAQGQLSGDPADFGPHVDDQRAHYWGFTFKPADFSAEGEPEEPTAGVRIYRDAYGVPSVYGDTGRDAWFGAGYAAAQDRLFMMEGIHRTALGTLAELTGPSAVPGDVQTKILTYSDADYAVMEANLSAEARDAVEGYVEGANTWRSKVLLDPRLLPAEYALLTSVPMIFTVKGVLAAGVLLSRFIAAEGGQEIENVRALRELEAKLGKAAGRAVFQDLVWQDDPKAATTVPGPATFGPGTTAVQREQAFTAMADYAATVPFDLAAGPGTGALPVPGGLIPDPAAPAARAALALTENLRSLHGGSFAFAVSPSRSKTGGAFLVSEPQLGYGYPSLLFELEVHGGGYDVRGVGAPGVPTVAIGHNERVAWALTTGYSKTIDSFIETTRPKDDGLNIDYLHDGDWKPADCRLESVAWRQAPQGVPLGPPSTTYTFPVCRTVHGPIVAATEDRARSVQYAMYRHEIDNIEGVLGWGHAQNLAEFTAAMRKVTWNENAVYADADGHIAFWHPGRFLRRPGGVDWRLPAPGTGDYDPQGYLTFEEMPHVVDPPQGYLANWNNKPAHGWPDGIGIGDTSRPGSPVQRVSTLQRLLAADSSLDFAEVQALEHEAGTSDHRYHAWRPLLDALPPGPLPADQRAALDAMLAWDGRTFTTPATETDPVNDTAGGTTFDAFARAVRTALFSDLPPAIVERQSKVGSHVYDSPPLDGLALRVLDPGFSGLPPKHDYLRGRSPMAVLREALASTVGTLATQYGSADPASWRRPHPRSNACSLTGGVIGPCLTMPYVDRGSWIQLVALNRPAAAPGPVQPAPLPATGLPVAVPMIAAAFLVGTFLIRRRPRW